MSLAFYLLSSVSHLFSQRPTEALQLSPGLHHHSFPAQLKKGPEGPPKNENKDFSFKNKVKEGAWETPSIKRPTLDLAQVTISWYDDAVRKLKYPVGEEQIAFWKDEFSGRKMGTGRH